MRENLTSGSVREIVFLTVFIKGRIICLLDKEGRMQGVKNGRMEGWKNGRMCQRPNAKRQTPDANAKCLVTKQWP